MHRVPDLFRDGDGAVSWKRVALGVGDLTDAGQRP